MKVQVLYLTKISHNTDLFWLKLISHSQQHPNTVIKTSAYLRKKKLLLQRCINMLRPFYIPATTIPGIQIQMYSPRKHWQISISSENKNKLNSSSFFFLLHLIKWSGNLNSDAIGNRELFQWQQILVLQFCIPVAVERERERAIELERERERKRERERGEDGKEDKWLEIDKLLPKRMLLPLLTFLSPSLPLFRFVLFSQMLCILDIRMEKCTVSREEI